jgi:hypothetical protein
MIFTYVDKVDGAGNTISAAHINALQDQKLDAYDAGAYASFAAAVAAIGATEVPLHVTAASTLAANVTTPATMNLVIHKGAPLTIPNGITLTINGPYSAGLYQTFICTGTGKVVFAAGAVREVYPEWWGAKGDGATDDQSAIQAAITATPSGGRLYLSEKIYHVHGTGSEVFLVTKPVNIEGASVSGSFISADSTVGASTDIFRIAPASTEIMNGIRWSGFTVAPATTSCGRHGINIDLTGSLAMQRAIFENLYIAAFGGYALCLTGEFGPTNSVVRNSKMEGGLKLINCGDSFKVRDNIIWGVNEGVYLDIYPGASNVEITGNTLVCAKEGVYVKAGTDLRITDNYFEQIVANTSANKSLITLAGDSGTDVANVHIEGNLFAMLAGYDLVYGVYLGYSFRTSLVNNDFGVGTPASMWTFRQSANASKTFVSGNTLRGSSTDFCTSVYDTNGDITYIPNDMSYYSTLTANAVQPVLNLGSLYLTANTNPTTITDFAAGLLGHNIKVFIRDAVTTIDFSGTNLKGNGGADWSPASGDWLEAIRMDSGVWYCTVHDCTA